MTNREDMVVDSKALTNVHSIFLAAIIVIAVVVGGVGYILFSGEEQGDTIKIGFIGDIDNLAGGASWKAAILAAEQVNAEGGVLGRHFEIIAEDDDSQSGTDMAIATNAINRLLTVDNVDFVICHTGVAGLLYQEKTSQFKKILFGSFVSAAENLTRRVDEDYENYKYYFGAGLNFTMTMQANLQSVLDCREYTGFNKIALVGQGPTGGSWIPFMEQSLIGYGFEVVHVTNIPMDAVEFSSYFAAAEAAGAEIMYPLIIGQAGIPFVKEYHTRQSPMVLWGMISMAQQSNSWELTEGKCEYTSNAGYPIVAGYPITNKTLATRDAYSERWGEEIMSYSSKTYDIVRFILPDAIRRAGTTESEAVVEALESTDIETSSARHFILTANHDILVPSAIHEYSQEDYLIICVFQWQDGVQVPVFPKGLMEEAEVTYAFPSWSGPWD